MIDCINGYVCADPTTGAPTATACNPFAPGATGCAADELCAIPTFAATGTVCSVDGDNDGVDDLDGFCLEIPGDALGASVCLPDCSGLDGGDSSACVAVAGDTAYCQPLEAKGAGLLTDLSDNAAPDGSTGYPDPSDIGVCLPAANTCADSSGCDTATSVGCVAGVCGHQASMPVRRAVFLARLLRVRRARPTALVVLRASVFRPQIPMVTVFRMRSKLASWDVRQMAVQVIVQLRTRSVQISPVAVAYLSVFQHLKRI